MRLFLSSISALIIVSSIGCAGPNTPFGAVESTLESPVVANRPVDVTDFKKTSLGYQIDFFPKRQNLHALRDFSLTITGHSTQPTTDNLRVIYNFKDVTASFLKNTKSYLDEEKKKLTLRVSKFRLPSSQEHEVEIFYLDPAQDQMLFAQYLPPECAIFKKQSIQNTEGFNPPKEYVDYILESSADTGFNPNLIAGLIAQESAFDPAAVSWAKAIGLTQVTPLAEQEVLQYHPEWPKHPELNRKPAAQIKTMISLGSVTPESEWRLSPQHSIKGGTTFLKHIEKYWRQPHNLAVIHSLPGERAVNFSKVLLASYNSGPARVKYSIQQLKGDWVKSPKLKEARKYVNRISSYCYSFAQKPASEDSRSKATDQLEATNEPEA